MDKRIISAAAAAVLACAMSCAVSAEAQVKLEAVPAEEVVMVGGKIEVTVTAENTGDEDLTGFALYFEDQAIHEQEPLAPREKVEKKIGLLAWDSDIEDEGIINVSVQAGELASPVTASCNVKVVPNDGSNPDPEEVQAKADAEKAAKKAAEALAAGSTDGIMNGAEDASAEAPAADNETPIPDTGNTSPAAAILAASAIAAAVTKKPRKE